MKTGTKNSVNGFWKLKIEARSYDDADLASTSSKKLKNDRKHYRAVT